MDNSVLVLPADIIADKTATVTAETAGLVAAYDFENINTTTLKVPDIKRTWGNTGKLHVQW